MTVTQAGSGSRPGGHFENWLPGRLENWLWGNLRNWLQENWDKIKKMATVLTKNQKELKRCRKYFPDTMLSVKVELLSKKGASSNIGWTQDKLAQPGHRTSSHTRAV